MKNTQNLTISIDAETLEILKRIAKQKGLSVSACIRLLIRTN
jgi:antitoxin component of RelBE/YafQ-DinJ toxin-antitoxin module